jgi:uncharacterized small protein (TIGR04563 family)
VTRTGRPRTAGITTPVKHKQSTCFSLAMLAEMQAEANRLERSLSWIAQLAWRIARERMRSTPIHSTRGTT